MHKKFFNIDLHVSVIADLRSIFTELGHGVTDKSLSGHTHIFKRTRADIPLLDNWRDIDKSMCDTFYEQYKDRLKRYDAFICTYPPAFALLYEKFNKPIIINVPIRPELPFQNDPTKLKWFIDYLKNGIDNKQIFLVANSQYEKRYCEEMLSREVKYIPSLCDYTGLKYKQNDGKFIVFGKFNIEDNDLIVHESRALEPNYKWKDLNRFRGSVFFPYNISLMKIFEQYTANIPMFFPSQEFMGWLIKNNLCMQEVSWTPEKKISPDWIKLSSFYDKEWFPFLEYFDSFEDLQTKLKTADLTSISRRMEFFNIIRKDNIKELWNGVINDIWK